MDLFQQLRHLHTKTENDLCSLKKAMNNPVRGFNPLDKSNSFISKPLSDIGTQKEQVQELIKELQEDMTLKNVIACCFDLMHYNTERLNEVEHHLQRYSMKPISKAIKEEKKPRGVQLPEETTSKDSDNSKTKILSTSATSNASTVPCPSQTNDYSHAPNPADFGITESCYEKFDRLEALLQSIQEKECRKHEKQKDDPILSPSYCPKFTQPHCFTSPVGYHAVSTVRSKQDISSILCLERGRVMPPGRTSSPCASGEMQDRYDCSGVSSRIIALDLTPIQSDHLTKQSKVGVGLQLTTNYQPTESSVTQKATLSSSLSSPNLSEQTVNILRQLKQLNIANTKPQPLWLSSCKKTLDENIPMSKETSVAAAHHSTRRCLNLGSKVEE